MKTIQGQGHCLHCDRDFPVRMSPPNHLLHFVLTMFTLGLWLPVWIVIEWRSRIWSCGACGSVAGRGVEGLHKVEFINMTPEDVERISSNRIWDVRKVIGLILFTALLLFVLYLALK